jgi:hypothetical protein
MKSQKVGLLFFASGGMELSWLYAWATFIMTSILRRPFPLPEALGTFGLAALITLIIQGRGWRIILILGLQFFGLILAASRIVYAFSYYSYPFLGQGWLIEFFRAQRDPLEWFTLVITLFWAVLLWLGGVTLARRSTAYFTICGRFDLGVAAFFLLLLIKFLLLVKGGIEVDDPMAELLFCAFFIFSLLAIGMARNRSGAQRDFLAGYQGIGVFASFTLVILLFGSGLVLLFLPYLRAGAELGYGVLKSAAGPLNPLLVSVLRFLFLHSRSRPETGSSSSGGNEMEFLSSGETSWWTELLEKIIAWGSLGLIGLLVLVVSCVGGWYLLRWLFSRAPGGERRPVQWNIFSWWAARLRAMLRFLWGKIITKVRRYKNAAQLYSALLVWGRRSGLPHAASETPREYGSRLRDRFPVVAREIVLIIHEYNEEVYGEIALDERRLTTVKLAWRRLRSPLHWPSRMKCWFLQPHEKEEHQNLSIS